MAQGDVIVFEEGKAKMVAGNWATTDNFYLGLVTNAVIPTAATATPVYTDFTEVTAGGAYTAGGADLGALSTLVSEAGGTMTFDSATNPSWAKNASSPTDAYWGIIYNYTDAGKDAIAYVDLAGPVDLTAGDLTISWNASGIFTVV